MDFIDTIGAAIDPEAFGRLDPAALGPARYCELTARADALRHAVSLALLGMADRYHVVESRVAEVAGVPYAIDGGRGSRLTASETSLGRMVAAVLRRGGDVRSLHILRHRHATDDVVASVVLPPSQKEAFEAETGLSLRAPVRLSLT